MRTLSCQSCRRRKIKCDRKSPCTNCIHLGEQCIHKDLDNRKKRHPHSYVQALESQLATLESFLKKVKDAPTNERLKMLESVTFADHLSCNGRDSDAVNVPKDDSIDFPISLDIRGPNTITFYGPTNVYGSSLRPSSVDAPFQVRQHPMFSPAITYCLKLFFKWQYTQFMYINREAFLLDYYHHYHDGRYCSEHLLYAMCALGSRMAPEPEVVNSSDKYYRLSWDTLMEYGLGRPHITSVQCLLCLGFYDIGMGNNSLGWLLSGLAFRMGQDLGFQLDPRKWFMNEIPVISAEDAAVRSRIYWGSYVADVFISFILGRPTTLKKSDTSIPGSVNLPDFDGIDEFKCDLGPAAKPATLFVMLLLLVDLSHIADAILFDVFSPSDLPYGINARLQNLGKYNLELMKWYLKLPDDVRWKKSDLKSHGQNPDMLAVCLYYYLIRICLNRPFLARKEVTSNDMTSKVICLDSMEDISQLLKAYRDAFGFESASLFMVYAAIVSCSVLIMLRNSSVLSERLDIEEKLKFFVMVLQKSSKSWKLAAKSLTLIETSLKDESNSAPDESFSLPNLNSRIVPEEIPIFNYLDETIKNEFIDGQSSLDINNEEYRSFFGGPPVFMTSASHNNL
ncbi:DNA-binding transcription factor [Schizosaccharomyces osmophilus]|uniref:DNA-binding transcription factor n=1 Tax=Schizosaccharomyces osmophilus TaxID=2545709 RepID=A0AAE9W791_9SCHI|nr:DNA-binding transcription factor [Schizosaccharomyces osmophilus]WBW71129.1 DNA-binding transcription factor [Schizosaccharomyces osmophilus]